MRKIGTFKDGLKEVMGVLEVKKGARKFARPGRKRNGMRRQIEPQKGTILDYLTKPTNPRNAITPIVHGKRLREETMTEPGSEVEKDWQTNAPEKKLRLGLTENTRRRGQNPLNRQSLRRKKEFCTKIQTKLGQYFGISAEKSHGI